MINKNDLFPIGIGTWGIGGFAEKDPNANLKRQQETLTYMFDKGMNFVEANMWYSQGLAVDILSKAFKQSSKKRDDIFICQAVYLKTNKLEDTESEVDAVLKQFDTDHVDTLEFTQSVFVQYPFADVVRVIEDLLRKGKTRFTSITNENPELLEKYHRHFGDKLFSHEVCFNFEVRENEKLGTIPYAQANDILTVVYQPLRRNRTANRNWHLLVELAEKYKVAQNQILLAWIVSKGFLPLTKSETIEHVDAHLTSLKIKLSPEDIKRLNEFEVPNYQAPKIDWNKTGDGIDVSQLSNVFDEEYDKQQK
jgi:diketogulonate reductase-like aldo/keto reductase